MYHQQVLNGAFMLDATVVGWQNRVNVSLLDLGDPIKCILGQLYASYVHGLIELTDRRRPRGFFGALWFRLRESLAPTDLFRWAIEHGFTVENTDDDEESDRWFDALTRSWTAAILDRRAMDEREREAAEELELVEVPA